jgi:hypothetical protein
VHQRRDASSEVTTNDQRGLTTRTIPVRILSALQLSRFTQRLPLHPVRLWGVRRNRVEAGLDGWWLLRCLHCRSVHGGSISGHGKRLILDGSGGRVQAHAG